jgi:hypothetical protein
MQITVSTKNTSQGNKIEFPCILMNERLNLIVHAIEPSHGIVLQAGDTKHTLGYLYYGFTFSDVFNCDWRYFYGSITITQ